MVVVGSGEPSSYVKLGREDLREKDDVVVDTLTKEQLLQMLEHSRTSLTTQCS